MIDDKQIIAETRYYLHQHGYKLTPQREAILHVLIHEEGHLSAEEIYAKVRQDHDNIGLATVYRTLEMLYDMKIIDRVSFDSQKIRYEWRKNNLQHSHHHLYCKSCGMIIEIEDDLIGVLSPILQDKYHFTIDDLPLSLYGYCEACKEKRCDSYE